MSRDSGAATAEQAPSKAEGTILRPRDLLSKEDCLEMFKQVYLARYFDVRLIKEKRRGRLKTHLFCPITKRLFWLDRYLV